jgi:two-component system chemotaxis response regulator CheY
MDKKVLLVDDAAFMRMMLKDILVNNSFSIVGEAQDGIEAIQKFIELKPDLVLMDIAMPNMDGIECLCEIKKIDPNAKVIMFSSMGQESIVIESIKSGAINFIVKPFETDGILKTLEKAFKE